MRFSHISLIAVMLVVIAVALSGCTGSSPATPSGGSTPAAGSPASGSSGNQPAAAAPSGADLFGNLNYNWVEYKMAMGSGDEAMTIYYKYNKQTGKCSRRFEGAGASDIPGGMPEMDCSGTGSSGQASADPNQVQSDAKVDCSLLDESVTVPAGTFSATKCTVTSQGTTSTSWIAKGKFLVKTEVKTDEGDMNMVLNTYG